MDRIYNTVDSIYIYMLCRKVWCKRKMFKNTFQSGFLSILYSIGSKPLQIWDKKVSIGAGHCRASLVFRVRGRVRVLGY